MRKISITCIASFLTCCFVLLLQTWCKSMTVLHLSRQKLSEPAQCAFLALKFPFSFPLDILIKVLFEKYNLFLSSKTWRMLGRCGMLVFNFSVNFCIAFTLNLTWRCGRNDTMPAKAFWKYLRIWNIAKILSIHLHIALLNLFYFPALGNSEVTPYRFFVSENATVGAEVGRLSENSSDKFVVLGDASAPFENFFDVNVLQSSGIIVTKRKLDHELFPSFDASIFNLSSNKVFKVKCLLHRCFIMQICS